jgi:hypothetical protein
MHGKAKRPCQRALFGYWDCIIGLCRVVVFMSTAPFMGD